MPINLQKAKKRRKKMQLQLLAFAAAYAKKMRKILKKATVAVYGSVARGDFNRASYIDVIMISDNLPQDFSKRQDVLYSAVEHGIEPKGYTISEFAGLRTKPNFVAMLSKKIVLLDDIKLF